MTNLKHKLKKHKISTILNTLFSPNTLNKINNKTNKNSTITNILKQNKTKTIHSHLNRETKKKYLN